MIYDFAVLGANGQQGRIVSRDLLENGHSVLLCATDDYGLDQLLEHKNAGHATIDLRNIEHVKKVIRKSGATVVVNCAIEDYNLVASQMCLELGVSYVDLGSTEEMSASQVSLNQGFKAKKIVGITGMGSTPGINNVMLRYARPQFDTIHTVHLGFSWKSNMPVFVPPFSLDTIAWEFEAPANILENGKWVKRYPNECQIEYDYRGIGRQKTYYTDHAEYYSFYEYLKDCGIKNIMVCSSFPEHSRQTILNLMELGFTKYGKGNMITVEGTTFDPIDSTLEVLRRIPIPKGYKEKENIWLKIYGTKDGKEKLVEMDAIVSTLPGWEDATCNVDTGMPVSITAQMIKDGRISQHGFYAPEFGIPPLPFFAELGRRKIAVYENGVRINNGNMIRQHISKQRVPAKV